MLPLNQSNSKPYQMFGFPDTKAAAPTIDSLDESGNEVRHNTEILYERRSGHWSVDKRQGSGKGSRERAEGSRIFSSLDPCIYSHNCR